MDLLNRPGKAPQPLSVMLVEDQTLTLDYIKGLIDWEKAGCTLVAEARNGKEALEKFKQYRPDIVFVDVVIPVIDGLEFSKAALTIFPWCRIVIISSYQQFDYAKQAISLGVVDYLLKHELNSRSLLAQIGKLRAVIAARVSHLKAEIGNFFTPLLQPAENREAGPLKQQYSGLTYLDHLSKFPRELLLENNLWIFAATPNPGGEAQSQTNLRPDFPLFLDRYRLLVSAEIYPAGFLVFYTPFMAGPSTPRELPDLASLVSKLRGKIKKPTASDAFFYTAHKIQNQQHPERKLTEIVLQVRANYANYPRGLIMAAEELEDLATGPGQSVSYDNGKGSDSSLIKQARQYIKNNYMHPIGTSDVAEAMGVSTAYLCQKFKEESESTVLHLITELRIERAKEMLLKCRAHVTEIAAACGFSSSQYFSHVFKRLTGSTPREFREQETIKMN